ncbi:MAG: ABC transporter permease [Phycisphaerales bacterium]
MYQTLLTRRYLTSKVMPLLAALAVCLCTAMVLIVWSVMGGFLSMLLRSGGTLFGDVTIAGPVTGFAYYEELIEDLEEDPRIAAATPVLESPALLATPRDNLTHMVRVIGVEPESYNEVTGYADTIYWKPPEKPTPKDRLGEDPRLRINPELYEEARTLTTFDPETGERVAALVMGMQVAGVNEWNAEGNFYEPRWVYFGSDKVTLSVLPISQRGAAIDVQARAVPVVNQFQSGLHDIDSNTVLIRLDALQRMLRMGEADRAAPPPDEPWAAIETPVVTDADPPRVTSVMIKAAEGVDAVDARMAAEDAYDAFAARRAGQVPRFPSIKTWDERPGIAGFIAAVKKEISLVLTLFAFISLTAVFLVFAIFWSIVSEKTKDIGVLRAVGATRGGVAGLFLLYGAVIGVIGSILGGTLAALIVLNINPIHEWLGEALGVYVWDPAIYHFPKIPSELDTQKVVIVLVSGVVASVLGALIPALKAANMDPVRSLRFE